LPVGVFAIAWLNTKVHLGNLLKDIGRRIAGMAKAAMRRFAALVQRAKVCTRKRTEQAPSGREMQTERRSDTDDLKRSLIA
jgi:hypothetical protein